MDQYTLTNGMKCIFLPDVSIKSFIILINIKVGSNNETKEQNGIAHYLEHMMFKSTRSYSSDVLLEKLDNIGAYYNATTTNEYTLFYIKCNYKHKKIVIKLMNEIFFYPKISTADINVERSVILDEYMIYQNDDGSLLTDYMMNHMYGNTSFGRPILGTPTTINKFTRSDFIKFRNMHYLPEKTCIVLSGNFKLKELKLYIKKKFDKNLKIPKHIVNRYQQKRQIKPELICKYEKNLKRTNIIICFRSYGINNINTFTLEIIATLLTGGMSSRLFLKLRDKKGYIYNISAHQTPFKNHGLFYIETSCNTEYVHDVIDIILSELKKLKKINISNKELHKSQISVTNSIIFMSESAFLKAKYYSINELLYNSKIKLENLPTKYNDVTINDVKEVCNRIFRNDNLNVILMGGIQETPKLIKILNL